MCGFPTHPWSEESARQLGSPPRELRHRGAHGGRRGLHRGATRGRQAEAAADRRETLRQSTVGLPTLNDILAELEKPGRDPRQPIQEFRFSDSVHTIDDLGEGMELPGIVTNITNFGAFVDIGVHQDGLVHISQLADKFVKDPNEVVKLHQQVMVRVTEVDLRRGRIALSMRKVKQP